MVSAKKEEERRLRANVVGVGEAVSDQHRANSLNTGWVKVPVKFPALAVVGAAHGRGENAGQPNRVRIATRPMEAPCGLRKKLRRC